MFSATCVATFPAICCSNSVNGRRADSLYNIIFFYSQCIGCFSVITNKGCCCCSYERYKRYINWTIKPTWSWSFCEFALWSTPSWLHSVIGGALHRCHRERNCLSSVHICDDLKPYSWKCYYDYYEDHFLFFFSDFECMFSSHLTGKYAPVLQENCAYFKSFRTEELNNRPLHGFWGHLGWAANTPKFTVNVWDFGRIGTAVAPLKGGGLPTWKCL